MAAAERRRAHAVVRGVKTARFAGPGGSFRNLLLQCEASHTQEASRMLSNAMNYDAIEILCGRCETKRQAASIWALGQWEMFFSIMVARPSWSFEEAERTLEVWGADPPYFAARF
jgi:hypothetical protein